MKRSTASRAQTRRNSLGKEHAAKAFMEERDPLTERIIGCAIAVHRELGPGLLESVYETPLCIQLAKAGLRFERQRVIPLIYEGVYVGDYKPDLIVEGEVVVDVKSVLHFEPVFIAQMLTYLKITGLRRGLILNFNKAVLKAGIKRVTRFD
ncbi:MAG TPA: GxxExxY protein [Vicinamibacterales bacterium]|nr:GxxExxY protein [Vicinamibacterales bacterium]